MAKQSFRVEPINFLFLTVSGIVNAFGVTLFLAPVKLYDSGISGTSMLLGQITPEAFSLSFFLLVLNIPLFLYGLRRQGAAFTIYAIYAVAIYSLGAALFNSFFSSPDTSPFAGSDLLLCAIFGGLISGVGSGMAIRYGGAMDGIEVLAVIFAKGLGLTVGTFVMIYNVALYFVCGLVMHSWVLPLYSIIAYAAANKTVDFIVEGLSRSKSAIIITRRPKEVCSALSDAFQSGITVVEAKGFYSGSPSTMVYFVVNRFQVGRMRTIVQNADPGAYISITEASDIFKPKRSPAPPKPPVAETAEAVCETTETPQNS